MTCRGLCNFCLQRSIWSCWSCHWRLMYRYTTLPTPTPTLTPTPTHRLRFFLIWGSFFSFFFFYSASCFIFWMSPPPPFFYKARKVLTIFFIKKRVLDKLSEKFSCWYPLISINTNSTYLEKCKNQRST